MTDLVGHVCAHLERLGYEITHHESGQVRAGHATHYNVVFKQFEHGIQFAAYFTVTDDGKRRQDEAFERANAFNREARICRCYLDDDFDLVIEACFPLMYDTAAFGTFVETMNSDFGMFHRDTVKLAEFLT